MSLREIARASAQRLPAPLYRVVRRIRVRRAIRNYQTRTVTRSYGHGVQLTLSIQDPLAAGWYDSEDREPSRWIEIEAARAYGLTRGACVFDVGAHQCVVGLVLADIVGPSGRVVAVEAERFNARVAAVNVSLNDAAQVVVLHAACAARPGTVSFQEGLNGRVVGGRLGTRRTRAVTIDELTKLYGPPDVVYVDIEGYEAQALQGAQQTLAAGATFVIEVHGSGELQATGGTAEEIVDCLDSYGYNLFRIVETDAAGQSLRPLERSPVPSGERFHLLAAR